MPFIINKLRIILAIKIIRLNTKLNCRTAAKIYNKPELILRNKIKNVIFLADRRPNAKNLTESEKEVIVQYLFRCVFAQILLLKNSRHLSFYKKSRPIL